MASDRINRRIERLLDQIEQEADEQNWQRVIALAQEVLGFDPENVDAKAFLQVAEERVSSSGVAPTAPSDSQPSGAPTVSTFSSGGQPTSFAGGRYHVKTSLGEGGKKKVFLAQDTLLDREVAFALIKTDGLDDVSRTRISREAQAMGRLGSHPHIVTVFDLGEHEGQPFMVTELMGGGDVEGVLEDAEDGKLSLEHAIALAIQTCRGLEFAHSRGIVHRDLKPGNVWLTSEGVAKIGDFGLAVSLDRSRLTAEGMMVGTVSYMPPEQAMGGEVSPKSDLYALGAMLYEMVTGRPPFLGDDAVAIIGQHINTPPVSPTWHNSQCPRPLEALILRLLAKDPSERPGSAADVLAALEAVNISAGVEKSSSDSVDVHALDSLAGGVFVGRQREMGELKAALEDTLSGRGRMVMLVGEPGIGKTRTAQELATYAGLRKAQVLWGRCYEGEGAPPYWPWVQAIRAYVRERDTGQLQIEMGAGMADIAEIVSDVHDRLPGLPAPAVLEPEQARFRLFDSICAFLTRASRTQPLVLVLDDLHWADQPSLLLLEFMAKELSGARLLLVGTYRDMELSRGHRLSTTLGELNRERLFQRVLLRGLDLDDVGRFIELASGVNPPIGLVEAVHRQTEGNPLFVTEVVRLLVQQGDLTSEELSTRDSWSVRIPEGVREVIGRRLDRLSERCNETLTVASIIGREFTLDLVKPLIEDLTEDRLLEVLDEALASRVIEELPKTVGRYQFTHALIQETLAGELATSRKVRLHARVAQAMEELYGSESDSHASELAYHYAEAAPVLGSDKLVYYSLIAGERALASFANEEALAHFESALAVKDISLTAAEPASDPETAALLFGRGRAQAATLPRHRIHEAVTSLSRALDYYAEAGEPDRAVAVAEYPFYPLIGQRIGNDQLIARALALVDPDSPRAGRLLSRYGRLMGLEEGDYDGAQDAFDKALAIARREGDPVLEMRTLADAANVDLIHLRFQESLDKSMRAIDLAGRTDDPHTKVLASYTAVLDNLQLGRLEVARDQASDLLAQAEGLRDRFWQCMALRANQDAAQMAGHFDAARDLSDRALAASATEPRGLCARAVLEYEVGDFARGEAFLDRLVEVLRLTPPGPAMENGVTPMAVAVIARISGTADRLDLAQATAEPVFSSPNAAPYCTANARLGMALLSVERGDIPTATEQYTALQSWRGTIFIFANVAVDRVLGVLAHAMGNLGSAIQHFEDSLGFCRKAGCRPELAWTCCDYADLLLESKNEGDRANAMSLLDESLAISGELGMRPLMERVLSRREILQA